MIEAYQFGSMKVAGRMYHHDLKIIQGEVHPEWWRKTSHSVEIDDVADIIAARPECLVVGRGKPGYMQVTDALRAALADAGIELLEAPTEEALQTFNRLHREGRNIAGAFHLTC